MPIAAPRKAAERIGGNNERFVFPEGEYQGVIEEVRLRDIPTDNEGNPFSGFASADGEVLGIQLGGITPLDVPEDVEIGQRKFFLDLALRDGPLTLETVDMDAGQGYPSWRLQQSARYVLNLALALDEADETPDGQIIVGQDFVDAVEQGNFNGRTVGFEVVHSRGKKNPETGERPTYDNIATFFPVP